MFDRTRREPDRAPSNLPLVFDGDRCLFNTGLYTRSRYETIYGLFEPNTSLTRASAGY